MAKKDDIKRFRGNNIYPNVVKENLSASAVFYGAGGVAAY